MPQRLKVSIPTKSERITLAQDIHDGIAQDLVALGYSIDEILARPETGGEMRRDLRRIRISISETLERVRRELFDLRSPVQASLSHELEELYRTSVGSISGYCQVEEIAVKSEIHALLINSSRELLRNSVRHSKAKRIWLSVVTTPTHLVLTVGDDGAGGAEITQNRYGLMGVSEKVSALGGEFTISGHHGSVATISLPLSHL